MHMTQAQYASRCKQNGLKFNDFDNNPFRKVLTCSNFFRHKVKPKNNKLLHLHCESVALSDERGIRKMDDIQGPTI